MERVSRICIGSIGMVKSCSTKTPAGRGGHVAVGDVEADAVLVLWIKTEDCCLQLAKW